MMMYWLLVAGCAMLFVMACYLENSRIASPSVLLTLAMLVASLLAALGLESWNTIQVQLSITLVGVIIIGLLAFIAGCQLVNIAYQNGSKARINSLALKRSPFVIKPASIIAVSVVCFVASCIWYASIGASVGSFDFSIIAGLLKEGDKSADYESTFGTALRCITYASSVLGCALFGRSVIDKQGRSIALSMLLIISSILPAAVSGVRTNVFHLMVGMIVASMLRSSVKGGGRLKIRTVLIALVVFVLIVEAFYAMIGLTGRKAYIMNPFDYFGYYVSGSIPALNYFVNSAFVPTGIAETFQGIQDLARRMGVVDVIPLSASSQWTAVNYGIDGVTNIYTIFRPAFHDYGFLGLGVYMAMLGVVFQVLYLKAFRSKVGFVVYSYLSYILIESMRDDFFSYWFGLEGLFTLSCLLLLIKTVFDNAPTSKPSKSQSEFNL